VNVLIILALTSGQSAQQDTNVRVALALANAGSVPNATEPAPTPAQVAKAVAPRCSVCGPDCDCGPDCRCDAAKAAGETVQISCPGGRCCGTPPQAQAVQYAPQQVTYQQPAQYSCCLPPQFQQQAYRQQAPQVTYYATRPTYTPAPQYVAPQPTYYQQPQRQYFQAAPQTCYGGGCQGGQCYGGGCQGGQCAAPSGRGLFGRRR